MPISKKVQNELFQRPTSHPDPNCSELLIRIPPTRLAQAPTPTPSPSQERSASSSRRSQRGATWTPHEHERFLEGLELFPSGPWKLVAAFVGSKTTRQTITHAQKYRQKIARRKRGLLITVNDKIQYAEQAHHEWSTGISPLPGLAPHRPWPEQPQSQPPDHALHMHPFHCPPPHLPQQQLYQHQPHQHHQQQQYTLTHEQLSTDYHDQQLQALFASTSELEFNLDSAAASDLDFASGATLELELETFMLELDLAEEGRAVAAQMHEARIV